MEHKNLKTSFLFCLLIVFFNANLLQANGTWDGGGDGVHWDDPLNWGDDIEPDATDIVTIPAGVTITVRMPGEVARSINMDAGSTLAIISGDLTLDEGGSGDLIDIPDGGTVSISAGATLNLLNGTNGFDINGTTTINNTGILNIIDMSSEAFDIDATTIINNSGVIAIDDTSSEAIEIDAMTTINNSGTLTIMDPGSEAIEVDGAPLLLTNLAGGLIEGIGPFNTDFLDIGSSAGGSVIDNFGIIRVNMDDRGTDFFDINGQTTIRNNAGALMDLDDIDDIVFDFSSSASGSTFDNFGTIDVFEAGDEFFQLSGDAMVTNHASGIIRLAEIADELFELFNTSKVTNDGLIEVMNVPGPPETTEELAELNEPENMFTNNGIINVVGVETFDLINIFEGIFTNNNLINIGFDPNIADSFDDAIDVDDDPDAFLINTQCGIINITSAHHIEIGAQGTLINDGIITTVFTGDNFVDGTFINNGTFAVPGKEFRNLGTSGITQRGAIVDGPIPATVSLCEKQIPTFNQWGLMIFGLLLLNLSIIAIRRKEYLL